MIQYKISHPSQFDAINECVYASFENSEGEAVSQVLKELVTQLQTTEEEVVGFVAQEDECIIGAVFFSRFEIEDSKVKAYLLSPMAIHPERQRQGIGQSLIQFAIETLQTQGAQLLLTYGDPAFYNKVGFQAITEEIVKAPHVLSFPHGWQAQSLYTKEVPVLNGKTMCVSPLDSANLW